MKKTSVVCVLVVGFLALNSVANANLIGYWKLDEPAGATVAVDSSGSGQNAAVIGAVGLNGNYGDFRTTLAGDYVDLPVSSISLYDTNTSFSWAARVRSAPGFTGPHGSIMGRGENAWANAGQQTMRINGNPATPGTADFQVWGLGGVSGTTPVNDGAWHHVAVTWNDVTNALDFYTDGVLEGSSTVNLAANPDINWQLDIGFQRGWFWSELDIEEVRIYDNALTAGGVAAIVPEPATLVLLSIGGLSLIRRKRKA